MPPATCRAFAASAALCSRESGKYELFKTTAHFDATAKNPAWLG